MKIVKSWGRPALMTGILICSSIAHAQTACNGTNENTAIPASTPTADFFVPSANDGTVVHVPTGLMWKRCAQGQTWNGSTCTGTSSQLTWASALSQADADNQGGYSDWRLPSAKELNSLIERRCFSPAINVAIFPNAASNSYWSSTPVAQAGDTAWEVSFVEGNIVSQFKTAGRLARLVRAGQ